MFAAGLALLGHIDEKFIDVVDVYEPLESGQRDKCFISKGYALPSCLEHCRAVAKYFCLPVSSGVAVESVYCHSA